jgi:hypothetical protein
MELDFERLCHGKGDPRSLQVISKSHVGELCHSKHSEASRIFK